MTWQNWSPRDIVIGMRTVMADGTITKTGGQVVKNVSGYDMARMHIGALGTLGVIAEVSFKLTPLPARQATVHGDVFDSDANCLGAALAVYGSSLVPLAISTLHGQKPKRGRWRQRRRPTFTHGASRRTGERAFGGRPTTLQSILQATRLPSPISGDRRR